MQQAVYYEQRQFLFGRMPLLLCLFHSLRIGDDNVAKVRDAIIRQNEFPGLGMSSVEGDYIGGGIDVAVEAVKVMYGLLVRKDDAHLVRRRHILGRQGIPGQALKPFWFGLRDSREFNTDINLCCHCTDALDRIIAGDFVRYNASAAIQ